MHTGVRFSVSYERLDAVSATSMHGAHRERDRQRDRDTERENIRNTEVYLIGHSARVNLKKKKNGKKEQFHVHVHKTEPPLDRHMPVPLM